MCSYWTSKGGFLNRISKYTKLTNTRKTILSTLLPNCNDILFERVLGRGRGSRGEYNPKGKNCQQIGL
jgi:hypothetical protein